MICEECDGLGKVHNDEKRRWERCPECHGTGTPAVQLQPAYAFALEQESELEGVSNEH